MNETSKKRVRWFIYPAFQLKLILINVGLVAMSACFIIYELLKSFKGLEKLGNDVQLPADHIYYVFIDWQLKKVLWSVGIASFVVIMVSALLTLILSHRLAGPIVRVLKHFQNMADTGKVDQEIKFRKSDYFPELPQAINRALAKIRHEKE
ncbi:MAG: hypothetical protein A2X86_20910 [Bdellovibrionales bacterium GWA2_49_15]|nr:MAG: hypothetical protein A2X86_20910 [Bdellovibrionales bacterium GWA2_49_15]HAZ14839.1 hypothetical protein [Bdellovibrionales bacterium]